MIIYLDTYETSAQTLNLHYQCCKYYSKSGVHICDIGKNADKQECNLQVGDVVKAHVQTQSIAKRGIVRKLSYSAKGMCIITAGLGHGSYEVQRYDDPTSSKRK